MKSSEGKDKDGSGRKSSSFSQCLRGVALAVLFLGTHVRSETTRLGPPLQVPVRRVVTLAPSLSELVLSLTDSESSVRLVGVSRHDEHPAVAKLPRVGSFNDPNLEAILALKPDLILVQPGPANRAAVETLAQLGKTVLVVPLHTLGDVERAYRDIGQALQRESQAQVRVTSLQNARARARQKTKGLPPRRVAIVYGFAPLVLAGPTSFAHELLEDVGAVNIAAKSQTPFPVFSPEALLRAVPHWVLDCSDDPRGAMAFRALPGMDKLPWKTGSRDLMQPGPALERALDELVLAIYGKP